MGKVVARSGAGFGFSFTKPKAKQFVPNKKQTSKK